MVEADEVSVAALARMVGKHQASVYRWIKASNSEANDATFVGAFLLLSEKLFNGPLKQALRRALFGDNGPEGVQLPVPDINQAA